MEHCGGCRYREARRLDNLRSDEISGMGRVLHGHGINSFFLVVVFQIHPGFVVQRLLAMIVNVGSRIAELRIAAPGDIDTAVELGLNYPKGPLALGDRLGARRVLAVLDGMQAVTHDPKYRATTWLRRRALLGVSLLTPD